MLLAYPKIPDSKNCPNEQCVAFEKYDGTNLHWVWEVELGWYAFGTRRSRFDLDEMGIAEFNAAHPGLEEAPEIFKRDFASPLESIFRENELYHCPEITVFTEFFGANSFAGKDKKDDRKQLVLFDADAGVFLPVKELPVDFEAGRGNPPLAAPFLPSVDLGHWCLLTSCT